MLDTTFALLVAAATVNGILAGASLDQSIKQLPARHRIGAIAFSVYSRAADLGNGIVWYASIGIGAALLSVLAAIAAYFQGAGAAEGLPIYLAAVLSVLHSLATARAAPTNFEQRCHENDEAALSSIFDRFARWQTLRAFLQVLTFITLLWAIVAYPR
ncbi:MAG: hypothetical protein ACR2M0_04440 [Chloroflexia bacterium]